jgi:hypothetical protein
VVLATYLLPKPDQGATSIYYPIEVIQIFMAIFGFTAWVGSALLSSIFLSLAGSQPYGVRFGRSFFRLLTGWISSNIRDYESYSERP